LHETAAADAASRQCCGFDIVGQIGQGKAVPEGRSMQFMLDLAKVICSIPAPASIQVASNHFKTQGKAP
jgi:hypothetical protein